MTTPSRLPKPLTRDELDRLEPVLRRRPELHAACVFLGETGLRSHEFASITSELARTWPKPHRWCRKCRRHRAVVRIIGKGSRERMVPLTPKALRAAQVMLPFSNGSLLPWSERGLRWLVQQAGQEVGVHAHPHRWRHTAATRWIEQGVDPLVVADLLGHANLGTTRLYVQINRERLWEAVHR